MARLTTHPFPTQNVQGCKSTVRYTQAHNSIHKNVTTLRVTSVCELHGLHRQTESPFISIAAVGKTRETCAKVTILTRYTRFRTV